MKPLTFTVIAGRQHARRLGFRTLNFDISPGKPALPHGIYAGWVDINRTRYRAAIHYGPRPVLTDPTISLEAHLIDTTLANPPVEAAVELVKRLRPIRDFPAEHDLRVQIAADVEAVKRALPLRVYVFGSFDGIHLGHRSFLRQARMYGDHLTVVIARDRNVERIKGRRPERPEEVRRAAVERLHLADRVVLGDAQDPYGSLRTESIDIICLGYDQAPSDAKLHALLKKAGKPEVTVIRLKAFLPWFFHSRIFNSLPRFW